MVTRLRTTVAIRITVDTMAAITVHTTAAIPITDGTTVTAITALPARVFPTGERSRLIERVPFSTNGREMKPAGLV